MTPPALASILLASADPDRLRRWYEQAFDATPDRDGFLHFGEMAVLIDHRDDAAPENSEPAGLILNVHVDDARSTAAHLEARGVAWLVPVERRKNAWFATLFDPDGNCIQIIELTDAERAAGSQ